MKYFIIAFSVVHFVSTFAMRGPLLATIKCLSQQKINRVSCAEQLQNILLKPDVRRPFYLLAEQYLKDSSKGKKKTRELSVFQSLSSTNSTQVQTVFRTEIQELIPLWVANRENNSEDASSHALYRYLISELFNKYKRPFEIGHPGFSPVPIQLSKSIRSIFDDLTLQDSANGFDHSEGAVKRRVLSTGSRITDYPILLIDAGKRIDKEKNRLMN